MSTIKLLKEIRRAMADQRVSQEFLAASIGVSRPTISMFLAGKRELSYDTLRSLLYKLGLTNLVSSRN